MKTTKGNVMYINGKDLSSLYLYAYDNHKKYSKEFFKKTEWGEAFSIIKEASDNTKSPFIPVMIDSKYFPTIDPSFGCTSFEAYVATMLIPGKEYSLGDMVHVLRPILESTPNARKMMEDTLCRLLAWGVLKYSDGYKNFIRTSVQFTKLVSFDDVQKWGELRLYSPEGKLLTTYNTEGRQVTYMSRKYLKQAGLNEVPVKKETEIKWDDTTTLKDIIEVMGRIVKKSFK